MKKNVFIIISVVLAIAVLAAAFMILTEEPEPAVGDGDVRLTVRFIDVGQGDSTLLESGGEYVLIDAGEREYGPTVVSYLSSLGVKELKYVIATHPHSDHIGGLAKVIDSFKTDAFITPETDQSSRTLLNVLDAVDRSGADFIDPVVGSTYSFGESEFTILGPVSDNYSGYNDYSVVTKVECGSVSFMLTGDAEALSEKEMIATGADLSSDVLKCGHHGSSTSSSAKFLKAVDPSYAVISCGKDNDYGHPHRETLKKLQLLGVPIYRTDELGTIIARTDGVTVSFSTVDRTLKPESFTIPTPDYYVGNRNSHVFHTPDCSGVSSMSEKNKVIFDTRDEAVDQGYTPCSSCDP